MIPKWGGLTKKKEKVARKCKENLEIFHQASKHALLWGAVRFTHLMREQFVRRREDESGENHAACAENWGKVRAGKVLQKVLAWKELLSDALKKKNNGKVWEFFESVPEKEVKGRKGSKKNGKIATRIVWGDEYGGGWRSCRQANWCPGEKGDNSFYCYAG